MAQAKRVVTTPLMLRLTFWSRLKLIFTWGRIFVIHEIRYGVYEPKILSASERVAVLPCWLKTPESLKHSEYSI